MLIAVAGCGSSSTDPPSLEIAWQQPLARTDVCPGSGRCAYAWSYGDPPAFEIAPFTADGYELTLTAAADRDHQEGATTMTFHGDAGQCEQFVGRIDVVVDVRGERDDRAFIPK